MGSLDAKLRRADGRLFLWQIYDHEVTNRCVWCLEVVGEGQKVFDGLMAEKAAVEEFSRLSQLLKEKDLFAQILKGGMEGAKRIEGVKR